MKPIEPGCLVFVAPYIGRRVREGKIVAMEVRPAISARVVDRYHENELVCTGCGKTVRRWLLDNDLGLGFPYAPCECRLTRIDSGDPDEITETEKEITA